MSLFGAMTQRWEVNRGFLGLLPVDSATELGRSSTDIGEGAVVFVPFIPLGGLGEVPRPPFPFFTVEGGSFVSTDGGGVATFSASSGSFFSSFSTFLNGIWLTLTLNLQI